MSGTVEEQDDQLWLEQSQPSLDIQITTAEHEAAILNVVAGEETEYDEEEDIMIHEHSPPQSPHEHASEEDEYEAALSPPNLTVEDRDILTKQQTLVTPNEKLSSDAGLMVLSSSTSSTTKKNETAPTKSSSAVMTIPSTSDPDDSNNGEIISTQMSGARISSSGGSIVRLRRGSTENETPAVDGEQPAAGAYRVLPVDGSSPTGMDDAENHLLGDNSQLEKSGRPVEAPEAASTLSSTPHGHNDIHATLVDEERIQDEALQNILQDAPIANVIKKENRCSRRCLIILILVGVLVVVAVVVAVIVARQGSSAFPFEDISETNAPVDLRTPGPTSSPAPSKAPSTGPSASPTLSPTLSAAGLDLLDFLKARSLDGGLALEDEESPQFKAFEWLWEDERTTNIAPYTRSKQLQRYVLAALYFATNGEAWLDPLGWLTHDFDECTWKSIICELGSVETISISNNGLDGTMPVELAILPSIRKITLSQNNLQGPIPTEMGLLTELVDLRLNVNRLTGAIPREIGALTKLTRLTLLGNVLQSPLPTELGLLTNLEILNLNQLDLTGGTLVTEIGRLRKLSELMVRKSRLGGTLPSELGELSELITLSVLGNKFAGTIPTEFGKLTSIRNLQLQENPRLTGGIPSDFSGMSQLRVATFFYCNLTGPLAPEFFWIPKLDDVKFNDNPYFTGSMPSEIGLATTLRQFTFSTNLVVGTLPTELGLLTRMEKFKAGETDMTGPLPSEIGLMTALEVLEFIQNAHTGTLPVEYSNLTNLQDLRLSENQGVMSGTIPSEYGLLTALTWLEIDQVRGTIPSSFESLTLLKTLRLSNGELAGSIPEGLVDLAPSLLTLDLSGNLLNSTIPEFLGDFTSLTELQLWGNDFQGEIPTSLGLIDYLEAAHFALNPNLVGSVGPLCDVETLVAMSVDCVVECACCSFCCTEKKSTENIFLELMIPAEGDVKDDCISDDFAVVQETISTKLPSGCPQPGSPAPKKGELPPGCPKPKSPGGRRYRRRMIRGSKRREKR